jgi:hypothetical protein
VFSAGAINALLKAAANFASLDKQKTSSFKRADCSNELT